MPDSCCLSTVIGCGLGVLSLPPEKVFLLKPIFFLIFLFPPLRRYSTSSSSQSQFKAAMKIHTEGCLDIFAEQIGGNIGGVGGVGIGIGLVQVNHDVVDVGDGDGDNYDEKDNSNSINFLDIFSLLG